MRSDFIFHPRTSNSRSHVTGGTYDAQGTKVFSLEGSWLDEIRLVDCLSGKKEVIWSAPTLQPDANLQFFFSAETCLLNYLSPQMQGVVAPTDSRFRMDMRLMEEGKIDEAEDEKVAIEVAQRQRRKQMEAQEAQGKGKYKPKFFV